MRIPDLPVDGLEPDAVDYFARGGRVEDVLQLSLAISLSRLATLQKATLDLYTLNAALAEPVAYSTTLDPPAILTRERAP